MLTLIPCLKIWSIQTHKLKPCFQTHKCFNKWWVTLYFISDPDTIRQAMQMQQMYGGNGGMGGMGGMGGLGGLGGFGGFGQQQPQGDPKVTYKSQL